MSIGEINNYGIIINNENGFEIDDACYKGIEYIINHLIKPLQTNIISYFQKLKKRETTSIKSRSNQIKEDAIIKNRIIEKEKEKQEYEAFALKITDFNSYLSDINSANPHSHYYDNSVEFQILVENEAYLLKMFKLLQFINNHGLYYYYCLDGNNNGKTSIVELNKLNYKYLHFATNNYNFFRCIDLDKDLKDFETFQKKIKEIERDVDRIRNSIMYIQLSPVKEKIPNDYLSKKERKEENNIQSFLQEMKDEEEKIKLLYYSIPTIHFVNLLQRSIFINNDLYFINYEMFLMKRHIKITNNIYLHVHLQNKEKFK